MGHSSTTIPNAGVPEIRLTYLILAHSDPTHFKRLLWRLARDSVNFVVYVDGKKDIEPFERAVEGLPNIFFCPDRKRVMWAGFSQVEAIVSLIDEALRRTASDYLVLLSGTDYPIRTHAQISSYFAAKKGKDLIRLSVIPETEKEILWRVRGYHFRELADRFTLRRKFLKPIELALRILPRQIKPGRKIAVGSTWWALTEDTAKYVLNAVKNDMDMRRQFKFAMGPDELIFHTILANSRMNENGALEEPYQDIRKTGGPFKQTNIHYINREIIKNIEEIRPLMSKQNRFLFARKFQSGASDHVLDAIDSILDGQELHVADSASDASLPQADTHLTKADALVRNIVSRDETGIAP